VAVSFGMKRRGYSRCLAVAWVIVTTAACQVTPTDSSAGRIGSGAGSTTGRGNHDSPRARIDQVHALTNAAAYADADAALASIDRMALSADQRFEVDLSEADLALAEHDLARASTAIARLAPVRPAQQREAAVVTGRYAAAAGRFADAARALIGAYDPSDPAALNEEIWSYISRTPIDQVDALAATSVDTIARGWWTLADTLLHAFDLDAERAALSAWLAAEPSHPAARALPAALARLRENTEPPRRIALVVPLTGPLGAAGTALRDGFLAAFYAADGHQTVRVYDSASEPFATLYERILADGADAIVGPLDKGGVSAVNQLRARTVPTLALNYLAQGETAAPGLLQLGLAIEDDARTIAARLLEDRVTRLAIFSTDADWSQRAAEQIRSELNGTTCAVVVDQRLSDPRAITENVGQALLIDQSKQRRSELEKILAEKLEFTPRRRDDLDGIVALTDSVKARALLPGLAFYFAGDLPIYGPAPMVQGAGPTELKDLEGARVTDMPWSVLPDRLRDAIDASIPNARGALDSLYALGVDAYRIADRIQALGTPGAPLRMLGATGVLSLGANGAIRREPMWALVHDGALIALPTIVQ